MALGEAQQVEEEGLSGNLGEELEVVGAGFVDAASLVEGDGVLKDFVRCGEVHARFLEVSAASYRAACTRWECAVGK